MCYQLGIALQQRNRGLAAIFIRSLTPLLSQDELSGAAETLAALSNGDAIESAGWFRVPKCVKDILRQRG